MTCSQPNLICVFGVEGMCKIVCNLCSAAFRLLVFDFCQREGGERRERRGEARRSGGEGKWDEEDGGHEGREGQGVGGGAARDMHASLRTRRKGVSHCVRHAWSTTHR